MTGTVPSKFGHALLASSQHFSTHFTDVLVLVLQLTHSVILEKVLIYLLNH